MTTSITSEFRDPIHGFIDVYPHERRIIDTPEFQRLRRIRQLGLTHYVYHGAEHSRFGHALGVMHLAGKAVDGVIGRNVELVRDTLKWTAGKTDDEKCRLVILARLAGLLHDVGHAPFSHTGDTKLFAEGDSHEGHGAKIVRASEIGQVIDADELCQSLGISKDDVADLIVGQSALPAGFVQELIDSPWDVDKMDYLLRDSYYCGVQYGTYDIGRILNTLTLEENEEEGSLKLAIEEGGIHALEAFVLARYYMFTQIYFHHVRRAYDLVLTDFVAELLGDVTSKDKYPGSDEIADFLSWDDSRVLYEANRRSNSNEKNLAWRVINRQHPKAVYETDDSPDKGVVRRVENELERSAKEKFPGLQFWLDGAVDQTEKFRRADMMVKSTGNRTEWREFSRMSQPLQGIQEIGKYRLYADVRGDVALDNEVRDYCRGLMS